MEKLDRNWSELLQELRVVQTGVQLLTGFLLTLSFQQRFTTLSSTQRSIYLDVVSGNVAAAVAGSAAGVLILSLWLLLPLNARRSP